MGFKQTTTHRFGKASYHQIGLVRGQFGNVDMGQWVKFLQDTGFDGWEEASWELDLDRCASDAGAEAYARERVDLARKHGLEIFTVAVHLQGPGTVVRCRHCGGVVMVLVEVREVTCVDLNGLEALEPAVRAGDSG